MRIVPAKLEDTQSIAEVELKSGYHKKGFDALALTNKLLRDKKEHVFVSKFKDEIMGYVSLRKTEYKCEITFLAVSKNYQNKGIGTELVKHTVKIAQRFKCKKLSLDVRNDNKKAIRLYTKLGFRIVGIKKKGNITKLIMEKSCINF